METVVCSTRFTSYQYEIQMLSAVAEACKSAGSRSLDANVLVTSRIPADLHSSIVSLLSLFVSSFLSQSVRDAFYSKRLLWACPFSFFSSPWTFVNYYVFIQTAIHLDSVIYGFLTSFHRSIDNPNQFHIFLLIFFAFQSTAVPHFFAAHIFLFFFVSQSWDILFFSIAFHCVDWFGVVCSLSLYLKRVNNYISKECNLNKPKKWFFFLIIVELGESFAYRGRVMLCAWNICRCYTLEINLVFERKLICRWVRNCLILVFAVV